MNKNSHRWSVLKATILVIGLLLITYTLFVHMAWHKNRFMFMLETDIETLTVDNLTMSNYSEVLSGDYDQLFIRRLNITNDYFIAQKYRLSFVGLEVAFDVDNAVFLYKDGFLEKKIMITSLEERIYFEQYLDILSKDENHEYIIFIALSNYEYNSANEILDFEIKIERQYRLFS